MPENIELPGASHNKTNQVERAVDTPADFTSPEELYKDLIAAIKKYHPSTDLSDIEKAYETAIVMYDIPGVVFDQPLNIPAAFLCIGVWAAASAVLANVALVRRK